MYLLNVLKNIQLSTICHLKVLKKKSSNYLYEVESKFPKSNERRHISIYFQNNVIGGRNIEYGQSEMEHGRVMIMEILIQTGEPYLQN